ncbi:LPXTG cell wall anchor domain-containing protein [Staphylococcus sp. 17KM0847]|nr:LPXTG cell wall anchor domain-containing protein [Staphylococcus sp. 17KM0847]
MGSIVTKTHTHKTTKNIDNNVKLTHKEMNKDKQLSDAVLPKTGEQATNTTLFGSLIAVLGSLFLFGRRKKEEK